MRNWSNKGIAHCRSSGCFLVESVDPAKEDFFICEPIVHRAKAAAGPEIQRLFRPRPARPRRRGQTRQAAAASYGTVPRTAIFLVPANFQDFQSITGGNIVKQT